MADENKFFGNGVPETAPEERRVSYRQYKDERGAFFFALIAGAVIFLVIAALPAYLAWTSMRSSDPSFLIIGICIVFLIFVLYIFCKSAGDLYDSLKETRECFYRTADVRELRVFRKRRRVFIAVCCALITAAGASVFTGCAVREHQRDAAYASALEQIENGAYQAAYAALESIGNADYKDTEGLMLLCEAYTEYEKDNTFSAAECLERARFHYLTEEQREKIDAFERQLTAINNKKTREFAEKEHQWLEERIKNGVPFVGMSEYRIGDTTLGPPAAEIRHNSEIRHNTLCHFNLYDWFRNGYCIYSVRCLDGEVIQVWDYRSSPIPPYVPKSGSKKKYDTPDPDDYDDAEALYEWYYDDFYDYEDAEEYYEGLD